MSAREHRHLHISLALLFPRKMRDNLYYYLKKNFRKVFEVLGTPVIDTCRRSYVLGFGVDVAVNF